MNDYAVAGSARDRLRSIADRLRAIREDARSLSADGRQRDALDMVAYLADMARLQAENILFGSPDSVEQPPVPASRM